MTIDAHQHFWQHAQPFDYTWQQADAMAPIRRDCLPEDLQPLMQTVGVDRTVFVQTQHDLAENRWVLGLAEKHPFIAGVVGWVDLTAEDCEGQLEQFKDHRRFVGIRHDTQRESNDAFIVRADVRRGLKVLQKHAMPFDLLFQTRHLHHAATLGREFPDLPMVLDHLAKPQIQAGEVNGWAKDLKAAAACENIYCKLSGLITEADWHNWRVEDLRPYVHTALELFGPERCMFGSDWPMCELAGTYQQTYQALMNAIGAVTPGEREQIFGGTAAQFYGLQVD